METDNNDYIIPKSKIMHLILYYVHGFVSYKHFDIYYNLKALLNKYCIKGHISNKQLCDIVIDVKLYFPKVNSIKLSEWRGYERGMTKKLLEQSLMKENIFLLDKRFENQE